MNTSPLPLTRRRALRRILGAAALAGFAGCGPSQTNTGRKTFAVSLQTMNNPFFVELNEGLKKVVESHGDQLLALDAQLKSDKQRNDLSDAIQQRPAAIFLNPVNWEGVRGSLMAAKRAGVPVITVDTPVGDADLVIAQVASDNIAAGRLAAEALGKAKPNAKVVVLHHSVTKSCLDRVAGFLDAARKFPGMAVVETQEGKANSADSLAVMKDILGRVRDLDAVFAINDPSALGCSAAIQGSPEWRDRGVLIVTVDGSQLGKDAVRDGRLLATVEQFPLEIGTKAANIAYASLSGQPFETDVKVAVKTFTKESA